MTNGIHRLTEALISQENTLTELLQLMEEEQRCIVALDMAKLENQVDRKQQAYARLEQSATKCRQLMAQMAAELGLPGAERLSLLIPRLGPAHREELQRQQQKLLELGAQLKRAEGSNGSLLQGALRTVNRSLEFFGRLLNRSATYSDAGRMVGGSATPRLLRREV